MKIKASEAVPGQWYEDDRWGRVLCCDRCRLWHPEGETLSLPGHIELTHLPDCTGWDWQPPKPEKRYRAFASFEEWWPHRERWVKLDGFVQKRPWYSVAQAEHDLDMGSIFVNDDGSDGEPFGVEVSE
jgi:hypothetical protein